MEQMNFLSPGYVRATLRHASEGETLNAFLRANRGRKVILTVLGFKGEDSSYSAVIRRVAREWGEGIAYWQLGNELDLPSHWSLGDDAFQDYARTLRRFRTNLLESGSVSKVSIGFSTQVLKTDRFKRFLSAIEEDSPGSIDAIDLHFHKRWTQGASLGEHIRMFREKLVDLEGFQDIPIIVTENSTWSGRPAIDARRRKQPGEQSELEQAVYFAESSYAALAAGAETVFLGVLVDRERIRGREAAAPFTLNGLFFCPKRTYAGAHDDPAKLAAYTFRKLSWLLEGVCSVREVSSGAGRKVCEYRVDGKRPHIVLWYNGGVGEDRGRSVRVVLSDEYGEPVVEVPLASEEKGGWAGSPGADKGQFRILNGSEGNDVVVNLRAWSPVAVVPLSAFKD